MKWVMIAAVFSSSIANSFAGEYGMPPEHQDFMDGYRYEYPGCDVGWSSRTLTFSLAGAGCNAITADRLRENALQSIEYVQGNSSAVNFFEYYEALQERTVETVVQSTENAAISIWEGACGDFKSGLNQGDFRGWYRMGDAERRNPGIRRTAVVSLYSEGWRFAQTTSGAINCAEIAPYRVKDYMSGIDISQ